MSRYFSDTWKKEVVTLLWFHLDHYDFKREHVPTYVKLMAAAFKTSYVVATVVALLEKLLLLVICSVFIDTIF